MNVVELLLSRGADIPYIDPDEWWPPIKRFFSKWPISMAIIALQELSLYYYLDASTIIDIYQYIGVLEDYQEEEEEEEEEEEDYFDDEEDDEE